MVKECLPHLSMLRFTLSSSFASNNMPIKSDSVFIYLFSLCLFFVVVQVQLSPFPPHHSHAPRDLVFKVNLD